MYFKTPGFDLELFRLINMDWRFPVLDWLMPLVSERTLWWGVFILVGAWLLARKNFRAFWLVLLVVGALAASDMAAYQVKEQIGRIRPLNAHAGTHFREDGLWQVRPPDYAPKEEPGNSYPSAHAANSMAAALMVALIWRRRGWPALVLPLVIGYSRVYLGKHYPTDVMAGWIVGATCAALVYTAWATLTGRYSLKT